MLPLLQLIQFICSSYHNGHVCICLPLPIAFLCCCCNLCPTLDHGTNKLRVEVTFFRPQFLRNFIRSLLCLTMHLFHAEFDFFSSNQGWCGIAIGPKQYVFVQCQHGSNIGFVEGLGVTGDHCTLQAAVVAFRQICFFIDRVPESQYSPRRFIQKAHEGVVIHDRAERPPRGSSSRFPPALPIRAFAGLATKDGC